MTETHQITLTDEELSIVRSSLYYCREAFKSARQLEERENVEATLDAIDFQIYGPGRG